MQLKTYLSENSVSLSEFARLVGASEGGIRKWLTGERVPRPEAVRKIQEVTGGAVTANDFFESAA
jgi:transcriptional regulator with XRE-family HTH domain